MGSLFPPKEKQKMAGFGRAYNIAVLHSVCLFRSILIYQLQSKVNLKCPSPNLSTDHRPYFARCISQTVFVVCRNWWKLEKHIMARKSDSTHKPGVVLQKRFAARTRGACGKTAILCGQTRISDTPKCHTKLFFILWMNPNYIPTPIPRMSTSCSIMLAPMWTRITGRWLGTFFILPCIGNNNHHWLIFFRRVAQPPTR